MTAPRLLQLPADRRRFIGGSDAAAIMGFSKFATPLDVYLEKREEERIMSRFDDPALVELLESGREMEPIIVNRAIRRKHLKVVARSSEERPIYYQDATYDFLACQIDFEWEVTRAVADEYELPARLIGSIQNGEAKRSSVFQRQQWGEEGTDEIPIEYAAQGAHGMGITGRELVAYPVGMGEDLLLYFLERTKLQDTIKEMRALALKFWAEHIVPGVPPAPRTPMDVANLLYKRKEGTVVEGTEEAVKLWEDLEVARDQATLATRRADELKFELGKFMLGVEAVNRSKDGSVKPTEKATPGNHILTWQGRKLMAVTLNSRSGIEAERLRSLYPDVAKDVTKTSKFFKFAPVKEKR